MKTLTMIPAEIESFVGKFRRLWHSGHDAQLTMSTKHGQAWISLNLGLGYSPPPPRQPRVSPPLYQPPPYSSPSSKSRNSPSRTRRRARRLFARESAPTDLLNETPQAASGEEAFANVNEALQTANGEEAFTHLGKPSLSEKEIKVVYVNTEEVFDKHNDRVQNSPGADAHVDNADEAFAKSSSEDTSHTGVVDAMKDGDNFKTTIESPAKPTPPSNLAASLNNITSTATTTESDQSQQCCDHACCPGRGRPPDKCCYHRCRKPLGHCM